MRLSLFFFVTSLIALTASAHDNENSEQVCKTVQKAIIGKNDSALSSLKETNGVLMAKSTKLPDAFSEAGISGFSMTGDVGAYNQMDFYYSGKKLFFRNKATFNKNDPNEKPDADAPEAGYYKIDRDSLPENGLICPLGKNVYQYHWVGIESGDLLCVRSAHGNTYGVVHVEAICPSNTVVFSWVYNPEAPPADQNNIIFEATKIKDLQSPGSLTLPAKR